MAFVAILIKGKHAKWVVVVVAASQRSRNIAAAFDTDNFATTDPSASMLLSPEGATLRPDKGAQYFPASFMKHPERIDASIYRALTGDKL